MSPRCKAFPWYIIYHFKINHKCVFITVTSNRCWLYARCITKRVSWPLAWGGAWMSDRTATLKCLLILFQKSQYIYIVPHITFIIILCWHKRLNCNFANGKSKDNLHKYGVKFRAYFYISNLNIFFIHEYVDGLFENVQIQWWDWLLIIQSSGLFLAFGHISASLIYEEMLWGIHFL